MIRIKPENKGLLHAKLQIPTGKKIPVKTMRQKMKDADPKLKKELVFALNARHFKK